MDNTNTILIVILVVILLVMLFTPHVTIIDTHPVKPVPVPVPVPLPVSKKPIGGCAGTRYGCCPNGVTPKMDAAGSNC